MHDQSRRYPVVYLLHGYTDSDDLWFGLKKHFINVPLGKWRKKIMIRSIMNLIRQIVILICPIVTLIGGKK